MRLLRLPAGRQVVCQEVRRTPRNDMEEVVIASPQELGDVAISSFNIITTYCENFWAINIS